MTNLVKIKPHLQSIDEAIVLRSIEASLNDCLTALEIVGYSPSNRARAEDLKEAIQWALEAGCFHTLKTDKEAAEDAEESFMEASHISGERSVQLSQLL